MPRRRKLSAAAVRKIYTSKQSAKELAEKYGVSVNTVYLVRQGRRRQDVTGALTPPRVERGRRAGRPVGQSIDIEALADAVIDRLVRRLRKL